MIYHYRFIPNNLTYYRKISDGRRIKKGVRDGEGRGCPQSITKVRMNPYCRLWPHEAA